jgi:hypothetical protein
LLAIGGLDTAELRRGRGAKGKKQNPGHSLPKADYVGQKETQVRPWRHCLGGRLPLGFTGGGAPPCGPPFVLCVFLRFLAFREGSSETSGKKLERNSTSFKGRREKVMMKMTYICRSPPKKKVTYFILFLFFNRPVLSRFCAFRNKGSKKKSIWGHHQTCSFLFLGFFSPAVILLDLGFGIFCRVFGRFVATGVQKRDKKTAEALASRWRPTQAPRKC